MTIGYALIVTRTLHSENLAEDVKPNQSVGEGLNIMVASKDCRTSVLPQPNVMFVKSK